jgi:NDP-sugar pyrophosphorylase family protein
MQAILFSAGYGTRLKPLTDAMPKALVEAGGKPMLQWNIEKLIAAGCNHLIVNVHHFPDQIVQFLQKHHNFGINIELSDESDEILDTGGGLMKAAGLFRPDEPILAHNADVISDLDLTKLSQFHTEKGALATVVVRARNTRRYLLFDEYMRLRGWRNLDSGEIRMTEGYQPDELKPLAFSGIQMISPELFSRVKLSGKFSIIQVYLALASTGRIVGYEDHAPVWMDIGKPDQLAEADKLLRLNQTGKITPL